MRSGNIRLVLLLAVVLLLLLQPIRTFPATSMIQTPQTAEAMRTHLRIYTATGARATLDDIVTRFRDADVVFIGEAHDDPVAHLVEIELLRLAYERAASKTTNALPRRVALSLEMFERDVQTPLDEYLAGLITETHFLQSTRPWSNYKNDYRPLIEFARERKISLIAANAPRRYVNRVGRLGQSSLDALSPSAKAWLAPLPYAAASAAYRAKFQALMGGAEQPAPSTPTTIAPSSSSTTGSSTTQPHGATIEKSSPILEAQSLWDATMAYAISEHLKRQPQTLVLHVNGKFHSEARLGAPEHLLRYRPGTRILVVTVEPEADFGTFDATRHTRLGDFVILTDAKLPRSM